MWLCGSEAQDPWWCGCASFWFPDMGRPTCGSARMMYAGWPHETAGISLGPEMQSHVGLWPCCGKPPLIDERRRRRNTGRVNCLLFAEWYNIGGCESNLQSALVRVCESRKWKLNVEKSRVAKMSDTSEKCNMRTKVKEEVMEEVDTLRYLRVNFSANGRMYADCRI